VRAENGGTPFIFDTSSLVTVSPNADAYRDTVVIHYSVTADSLVRFDVARRGAAERIIASEKVAAGEGYNGEDCVEELCVYRSPT